MKKRLLSLLLVASMATAMLVGCGQEQQASNTETSKTSTESGTVSETTETEQKVAYEDLPTITVLGGHGYTYESDDNEIWRMVAEKVGAKIHFLGADADKKNAMIASGEGFDILLSGTSDLKNIATGGNLIALDDLIAEQAPEIAEAIPTFISYSKENYSDDTGSLYWLPAELKHNGKSVGSKDETAGMIRWDLYAKLGYPETNSADEFLQVIADMLAANPKNEAGQKVYGMTVPSDKLTHTFQQPFVAWAGQVAYSTTAAYTYDGMEYVNMYGDTGCFWDAIDFYHKAYQMGLLDPDAFTLTEADMKAKAAAGRLLFINSSWQTDTMPEGQGFSAIPKNWAAAGVAESNVSSLVSFNYGLGINKKSENVDLCLKYLTFVLSEEGANLIYNGIEGEHYTVDTNGVRSLTDAGLALYKDGTKWAEAGLGTTEVGHFVGFAKNAIASDGKAMLLGLDTSYFKETLTDIQKDFSEHYGVNYPAEAYVQYAEKYNLPKSNMVDGLVRLNLPKAADDISQLEMAVQTEAEGLIADLVMCKDSEYEAKVQKAKEQIAKIGLDKIDEFYKSNWQSAFDKAEAMK